MNVDEDRCFLKKKKQQNWQVLYTPTTGSRKTKKIQHIRSLTANNGPVDHTINHKGGGIWIQIFQIFRPVSNFKKSSTPSSDSSREYTQRKTAKNNNKSIQQQRRATTAVKQELYPHTMNRRRPDPARWLGCWRKCNRKITNLR